MTDNLRKEVIKEVFGTATDIIIVENIESKIAKCIDLAAQKAALAERERVLDEIGRKLVFKVDLMSGKERYELSCKDWKKLRSTPKEGESR